MKKNKLGAILTIIFSIFIGCAFMYGIIYYFPTYIVHSVKKEDVTVNDTGISKSVKKVYDAVVYVTSTGSDSASIGTGFVYKKGEKSAYIITNYHVVDGANNIKITFSDDTSTTAKYLGGDEYSDIAVLTVDLNTIKKIVSIGNNSKMNVGDTVFAIGAPMGIDYKGTVTKGILSGKDRLVDVSLSNSGASDWIMNVMQTDAAINPENSGGPLCNINGEVIGVTSMKIVKTETEGLGFAIPIEDAISYASQIEKNKKVERPYIGLQTVNTNQVKSTIFSNESSSIESEGAVVVQVEKNSPAGDAGIQQGDIIIKINDNEIKSVAKFRYYLYENDPGEQITVTVKRNGKEKEIKVKLISREN